MASLPSHSIRRLLTRRYLVALAFVALLAVAEQGVVQFELNQQAEDSREVNLAGRQRMLSQRIAKEALALNQGRRADLRALDADVATWAQAHDGLLDGDPELQLSGIDDPEIRADLAQLTPYIERIEDAVAAFEDALARSDAEEADLALRTILDVEPVFLVRMDAIVFALDAESVLANRKVRAIEIGLLLGMLLALAVLGWVVLRPAATYAAASVDKQHRLLRAIIDTVPDHIYAKDLDGRATLRNLASARALGYDDPETCLGASDVEAPIERDVANEVLDDDLRVVQTGEPLVNKEEPIETNGETRWLSTTKVPLYDADGRVMGLVGISRDITVAKHAKAALSDAKDAAETAAQAKGEFLANMSHEIRTPLNGVLGMTEMLRETQLNPEQREFVEIVHSSGNALLGIINDVLDFSKIEAGHVELATEPFALHRLVEEVLDVVAVSATRAGLGLGYFIEPDVPATLVGDAYRLRQVLTNLLSNAVKFTREGGVSVRASLDRPVAGHIAALHIAVEDTGVGIPAEKLDHVFGSFTQADASTTRQFGGTGLGLAISGQLVGLMDGELWAESEVGVGSTFHITLDLPVGPLPDDAPAPPPAALDGLRVLVADDNAVTLRMLDLQLRAWGAQPILLSRPSEAFSWLDTHPRPSLAFLAMHMPEMDGLDLAATIREQYPPDTLPLVLLSAIGDALSRTAAERVGLAAVLTQPVKQAPLRSAVAAALSSAAESSAAGAGNGTPHAAPAAPARVSPTVKRLLLVEDNAANQRVALTMLRRLGSGADLVADGRAALDALATTAYDVVLMDVQMPVLDGIETTRRLRAEPERYGRPYVIGLTANALDSDRERCLAAGMDEHLAKPVRKRTLAAALARAKVACENVD
ncbi:MAG: response regulator [Bacteroidota bacterium]